MNERQRSSSSRTSSVSTFTDRTHLDRSLVHRSFCAEHPDAESNERMEFLGDAVLGLSVTNHVYAAYPDLPEGELAKLRASVVNAEVLAEPRRGDRGRSRAAARQGRGRVGRTHEGIDPRRCDGGRDRRGVPRRRLARRATRCVLRLLGDRIREGAAGPGGHDFKTRLQELAARRFDQLPRYHVRAEGPDHSKRVLRHGLDRWRGARRG